MDSDIPRYAGTLMGRNHAKTFYSVVTPDQLNRYVNSFSNINMKQAWEQEFFDASIRKIKQIKMRTTPFPNVIDSSLADGDIDPLDLLNSLCGDSESSNLFLSSLNRLSQHYEQKQQTLIHADLHCGNILYRIDSDGQLDLKLVDFENCGKICNN